MLYNSEKWLVDNGYRVGLKVTLAKDTLQPRMRDYAGTYAIDDPHDDEEGFVLVGNNRNDLVTEAFLHLSERG